MSFKLNLSSPRAEHRISAHKRRGVRGIGIGCAVPASQYIHPEFGLFYPTPRFRRQLRVALACLVVAGVGTTLMDRAERPELDAAVTRVDAASIVETFPATSLTPFVPLSSNQTVVEGARPASDKPRCVGDALADLDGNCVSIKLRKPRMVRVATDRAAIAAVALGRTASLSDSNIDAALPASSAGRDDPEKSGQAASAPLAAAGSTEPSQKAAATPKKAQSLAHRQNQRRDQNRYGAPSWREVRVDDWGARGYAPSDYQRGGYGRQGFVRNFW
jgi:hypothetical protein